MTSMLTPIDVYQLTTIAILIVLSAVFSASETAITSLGSLKAKHIIDTNNRAVRQLTLWLTHPERVLTTILLFNNLVNIITAALATDLATRHFANHAIGIATGAVTFLILIFGEILPKAVAKAHHETLALIMVRVIFVLYIMAYPIVWALAEFANFAIKLGGSKVPEQPPITEDELEFLVNVGERAGVLEETKKDMLVGVFDFDETKVREIMTPRPDVKMIGSDASFDDALMTAIESGFSRIPVYDAENGVDHVVGILLVKDLLKVAREGNYENGGFKIADVLRDPFFVPESRLIIDVFRDLKKTKNHIAIVVDEHGGTAGLVTLEDILEEIVGEIQDEYDVEEADVMELEDGIFDVTGSINIYNFLEFFELNESDITETREPDVDTLAGWITQLAGDLPSVGKTFRIGPLNIEVTEVERNRIQRFRVSRVVGEISQPQPEA